LLLVRATVDVERRPISGENSVGASTCAVEAPTCACDSVLVLRWLADRAARGGRRADRAPGGEGGTDRAARGEAHWATGGA